MWNSGKKNSRFARQKKNILTLVLSEKIFLNVHYVFNPDHYIGIVIANATLLYK
jgi:hypothetical protein